MAAGRAMIRGTVLGLALAAAAAAAFVAVRLYVAEPPAPGREQAGAVPIGGSFTLTDQHGQVRTEADFRGRYMLVYFGYTYCPDVCPMTLGAMGAAIDALGEEGREVVPVFITIDPARDTVARLAEFAGNFHPRLVALTGTEAQVAEATRAYRVYSAKAEPGSAGDDYLVDHTSIVYLLGPRGRYVTHFTHGTKAEEMAARIAEHL